MSTISSTISSYRNISLSKSHDSSLGLVSHMERLKLSALTKAAELSPTIKEVTIGKRSSLNKEVIVSDPTIVCLEKKVEEKEEDLIEDTIGEKFQHAIKIKQFEDKLHEDSEIIFNNLVEKMISKRSEVMKNFWCKQSEECDRKALEIKARKLRMIKGLQENDNQSLLEKAKEDERQTQIINKQTIEQMNRILEEQNRATARFASITDCHTKICYSYYEINELLQTDQYAKRVCDKYIITLNTVIGNINAILDLCKTGSISDKDVTQADVLASNIENIRRKIVEDISNIKQNELIKQKEAEELIKIELEKQKAKLELEKQLLEKQKVLDQAKKTKPEYYSCKNYAYYEELRNFLTLYENNYKDLLANPSMRKFKFDCQKAVNTPLNTMSSVSPSHVRDKYDKLSQLLRGEIVQVLDIKFQATKHPQGLYYVTSLLAKKIVRQGGLVVSSNPEAAFPIASITVALSAQFPDFGRLLEAYFHDECPYLVPMFLPQKKGQTDKEFYRSRGYSYDDDEVIEKQDKFLNRMSGIFKLQCAIWITKCPRFVKTTNPRGLKYGWQWLASFINLKPEPDISATLIHDFIQICGSEFLAAYKRQFTKIMNLISTDYLKLLEKVDDGGPKTRVEVFIQNVLKTGYIPPPSGLIPHNTW